MEKLTEAMKLSPAHGAQAILNEMGLSDAEKLAEALIAKVKFHRSTKE